MSWVEKKIVQQIKAETGEEMLAISNRAQTKGIVASMEIHDRYWWNVPGQVKDYFCAKNAVARINNKNYNV